MATKHPRMATPKNSGSIYRCRLSLVPNKQGGFQTLRWQVVGSDHSVSDSSFSARTAIFLARPMLEGIKGSVLSDGQFHKITI